MHSARLPEVDSYEVTAGVCWGFHHELYAFRTSGVSFLAANLLASEHPELAMHPRKHPTHAMHLTRLEREDPEPSGLAVEPALKDVGSLCERNQGQVSEP